MALIKCPECGNEMSSSALSCPVCGAPNKAAQAKEEYVKSNQTTSTILSVIGLCIVLFGRDLGMSDFTVYAIGGTLIVGSIILGIAAKKGKDNEG